MSNINTKIEKRKQLQFHTMKFNSLRAKEFDYNITITPQEARENGEMIGLFDNQFLRSIRKIKGKEFDENYLNELLKDRGILRKQLHKVGKVNSEKINELELQLNEVQNKIDTLLYIEEYVTIVMEHQSHYKHMYENGLYINDKKYIRFSCSAGQARVSTVVFVEEDVAKKLNIIVDNGRNLDMEFSPSKLNAYIGLGSSATKIVSKPRFCIIPDCETKLKVKVNFVTETDYEEDDIIEQKQVEISFNRFDGMGLISYRKAKEWADELGLDYIPGQWCIRQSFLKGMLCTFDIHDFCRDENEGNYKIKTSYKDKNGKNRVVDLRDIDVICTESQFKLWDSYNSQEDYEYNCDVHGWEWGVSLYTPKEDKNILNMNYQFLQTLNLSKKDVENICQQSVDWINGITDENIYYTLLFLLGDDVTRESIESYLKNSDNYWVKSLIVNHELINDKYIKNKIYDLIRQKIKNFCLGRVLVDGNFQVLVSDPYAFMQHTCNKEVTGLLGENEYYSNYWNNKDVKLVDSMRAPLTSRSEHLKLQLKNNELMQKWYKYCYTGIIVNVHGSETLNWAGSDWDYDIIATTSNKIVLEGVYESELPVVYEAPKPAKIHIKDDDLFSSDLFSFGSIIGSITNKSTSGYALLPLFKENSEEYRVTMNRIRMCTKLQSAQIDKAKIGKKVKGIPKNWTKYDKLKNDDSDETKATKDFYNRILLDKHPYFFTHLYADTKRKYKKHINGYDLSCRQLFNLTLNELIAKKRRSKKEREFLNQFYDFMPVIDTECVMNNVCKYIESVDFDIKSKIKNSENLYEALMSGATEKNDEIYKQVYDNCIEFVKELKDLASCGINGRSNIGKFNEDVKSRTDCMLATFKDNLKNICSDEVELTDYLIEIFYVDKPNFNKNLLWQPFGKIMFRNILDKNDKHILFPVPDEIGNIEYLNQNFKLEEVVVW